MCTKFLPGGDGGLVGAVEDDIAALTGQVGLDATLMGEPQESMG